MFFLTLPNSKIEVDIPLIGYYPEANLPDEGISPDKLVKMKLEDFINNRDTQLDYTIDLMSGEI